MIPTESNPRTAPIAMYASSALEGGGAISRTANAGPVPTNDARTAAYPASGTIEGLQICAADEDWFSIAAGGEVRIEFTGADGDLDLIAFDANGVRVDSSAGTGNTERVTVPAGGSVEVYGYSGARNTYRLIAP